ncbi:YibE/F family protein [Oenococcus oeni]|uniref:Integral membrane protein n=1 Tax=Oenococcus oeni ATCC BAA-1163 TaxID=379360 RepID=A0NL89_OENOE|nr:YibE/F family protein [Oenococcus oeni]EAV38760.1 integral membrane protein [Oenococcus oeni ATCC BAA-1163]EJO02260.1 multitransmembrane protein [Oenococcus oeni AWRIB418]KDE87603.1 membrane protein [Oenococcus oeni]KEP88133.1 membrane protein [Oenococcus oeni IOEB_0501]KGH59099.1 membrane protein [Oenococcus oeni IOEB_9805]
MSTFLWLIFILFSLLILVARKQGLKAFFGLFINLCAIFLLIVLINWQFNVYLVTILISFGILAVSIYLSADNQKVTNYAFTSSLIVLAIVIILIIPINYIANVQGFATESSEELEGLLLSVGLNFSNISFIVTVIASLGAIAEASMAISADLNELIESTPEITTASLYKQGIIIGSQIIGTALNTLFFGVLGDNLTLAMFYMRLNYTFAQLINDKLVVAAILDLLIAMIGVLLTIPVTILIVSRGHIKNGSLNKKNSN